METDCKALCVAASRGDVEAVAAILNRHPELIALKHEGATALHFAALEGQDAAVEFLLHRGADINLPDDEFGSPPAGWANEKGHQATVELLERHGASMSTNQAAAWGFLHQLEALLEAEPDLINRCNGFGAPLHEAVIWGRIEIVDYLLARGANPHVQSSEGKTALELASDQMRDGRSHAPIVSEERRRELERNCAVIAGMLARAITSDQL